MECQEKLPHKSIEIRLYTIIHIKFYRMSDEVDYMLRVVVADMATYDALYRKLISNIEQTDFNSSFAMEQIKFNTAPPPVAEDAAGDGNAS